MLTALRSFTHGLRRAWPLRLELRGHVQVFAEESEYDRFLSSRIEVPADCIERLAALDAHGVQRQLRHTRRSHKNSVDILVRALETLVVLFAIVAFLAWVMGPSRPARFVRRGVDAVLDAGAHGLVRTGLPLGPVPAFLTRWRKPIVVAVVILALVILWSVRTPGISGVVWATVGALLLLALLEIIARATPPRAPVPSPA